MFDRKSDYAINKKDPEAIVCKSVSGVHIRLTRVDFSSEEEFQKWKAWSDEDYHTREKAEHIIPVIPSRSLLSAPVRSISSRVTYISAQQPSK